VEHLKCAAFIKSHMQTRVLEITGDIENPQVVLRTRAPLAPYVSLSYCWGSDQASKTTKARLEQYGIGIEPDALPRTIQDAILVTLGRVLCANMEREFLATVPVDFLAVSSRQVKYICGAIVVVGMHDWSGGL
jgi:hypothetical protein